PPVRVTVQDAFGNIVTNATNLVTVAIQVGTGTTGANLGGTRTVPAAAGIATFNDLSIDSAGTGYALTASASLTGATSAAFNVTHGTATKLAFTVQPSSVVAGVAFAPSVRVRVQDALGNTVTNAGNSITITLDPNPGGGQLRGPATTLSATGGVATFPGLNVDKVGTGYTLRSTATGLTLAPSSAFTVSHAPASRLAFTAQPSTAAAGAAISPAVQVTVQDSLGNTVTSSNAGITLAITSGTGTAGATLLGGSATAVNGVATFPSLSIDKSGTGYTLTATSAGLQSAESAGFDIAAGAPTKIALTGQPTTTQAGNVITPAVQVTVQDVFGNTVTTANNSITVAIGNDPSGGATLSGTKTLSASGGVATFNDLRINLVGVGFTLTASEPTPLTGATSAAFNVTTGTPDRLAFTTQPVGTQAGAIIPTVRVTAQDSLGNTITSFEDTVRLSITGGTGAPGATLGGTRAVKAVAGVAVFTDLSIDKANQGFPSYTLTATDGGLTGATSTGFSITPA
ncbi:MAG: beta strand repeat-containing protein, partial [Gammaproteobacteria bacterium]